MKQREAQSSKCPCCGQHVPRTRSAIAPSDHETIIAIIDQEASKAGITRVALLDGRQAELTAARWNAICRAYEETRVGIATLARVFGRDRSSIRYALRHHL